MLQKHDIDILNSIYKNSRMAHDCTKLMCSRCKNAELSDYLLRQQKHYAKNCMTARDKIEAAGKQAKKLPKMERVMAEMGIYMKTAADKTESNIAEILYNGTNMGIVDISRTLNHSAKAADSTKRLAESLLDEEVKYADGLKKFL